MLNANGVSLGGGGTGSASWNYVTVNSTNSPIVAQSGIYYRVDASLGPVIINLPPLSSLARVGIGDATGFISETNTVTIIPSSSETILGQPELVLNSAYQTVKLIEAGLNSSWMFEMSETFIDDNIFGLGTAVGKSWIYKRISDLDSPLNAQPGTFYIVDTSNGPVQINLPTGSVDDIYGFTDAELTFDLNNVTIVPTAPDLIAKQLELVLTTAGNCFTTVFNSGNYVITSAEDFLDQVGAGNQAFSNVLVDLGTVNTNTSIDIDWSQIVSYKAIVDTGSIVSFTFSNLPTDSHTQIFFFLRYLGGAFSFPNNVAWSGMNTVGTQYVFDPGYDYLIIFDALGGVNVGAGVSIKTPGQLF